MFSLMSFDANDPQGTQIITNTPTTFGVLT